MTERQSPSVILFLKIPWVWTDNGIKSELHCMFKKFLERMYVFNREKNVKILSQKDLKL